MRPRHTGANSDDPKVLRMPYWLPQLITFLVAVIGAFYKNIQKKINDVPVYWHGLPVLTPLGWLLLVGFMVSLGASIQQARNAARGNYEEKERADALQKTLNQVNTTSASSLKLQIDRFKEILDTQDRLGKTTIKKISDSSDQLASNIDKSTGRLDSSINISSYLLRGNITQSSHLLRTNILEASLATKSSIPTIYLYVTQHGIVHDFADAYNEVKEVRESRAYKVRNGIAVIPRSIRDVLFPFADNSARGSGDIGSVRLKIRDDWGNEHQITTSGIIKPVGASSNTTFTCVEASVSRHPDVFWLTFDFDKIWSWQAINESLKARFAKNEYVMIVKRTGIAEVPPRPPSFTNATLAISLSYEPPITIVMPLRVKNYAYNSMNKSYSYELHISKAPEIRTDYAYQQEPSQGNCRDGS